MNNHDFIKSLSKEKELLEKLAPNSIDAQIELNEIMEQAENPKVLAMLMFKLTKEREKTNSLLESINDKYDNIMFNLKTQEITPETPIHNTIALHGQEQQRFEVLPEQDQLILKITEERGGASAKDIQTMLNYKGINAACQRLNKLYREGYLKKIQSGRKVLYLAKS